MFYLFFFYFSFLFSFRGIFPRTLQTRFCLACATYGLPNSSLTLSFRVHTLKIKVGWGYTGCGYNDEMGRFI